MATFKILIGKEKQDNTFPVIIQIYHNGQKRYLPTGHYVNKKKLTPKGKIKDEYIINTLNNDIVVYKDKLARVLSLNSKSAQEIKDLLASKEITDIEFIGFGKNFLKKQSEGTACNTAKALKALTDFLGYHTISIHQINLKLLQSFETYLREERGTGNSGINGYMGKIKQLFIAARIQYNDEETGKLVIKHNPFVKYKIPKVDKAKKRNLKPETIKIIRDTPYIGSLAEISKDVFMLSFYLIGMNTVDLYNITDYKDGRLSYYRTKTESRKKEFSFISIKVEPEVLPYLEKYKDLTGKRVFNFYQRYKSFTTFSISMAMGLSQICVKDKITEKVTPYYARHSWATIARNICKVSKDDVHFALNHSDPDMKVTDLYIEEDYSIIDEANRKVLDTLK